jgi:hypothetical protein
MNTLKKRRITDVLDDIHWKVQQLVIAFLVILSGVICISDLGVYVAGVATANDDTVIDFSPLGKGILALFLCLFTVVLYNARHKVRAKTHPKEIKDDTRGG